MELNVKRKKLHKEKKKVNLLNHIKRIMERIFYKRFLKILWPFTRTISIRLFCYLLLNYLGVRIYPLFELLNTKCKNSINKIVFYLNN